MLGIIDKIEFRKIKNNFPKKLSTEERKKKTKKILVKGDKTGKIK